MGKKKPKDIGKIDISRLATLPPEEIQRLIDSVAQSCVDQLKSPFLVMYYATKTSMSAPDVSRVYQILRRVDKSEPLSVFIHSGGGDIHTAYKLAKLFQRCCEYKIVIPEYAKSAATLVALGADEILMNPIAEMGPLDPVIQFSNGLLIPGFAIRNAIKVLENEVASCEDPEVRKLMAEHILGPIAVKIDPYVLATVRDTPELAKNYGNKILRARRYKASVAERVVNRLTELGHPSHGYVIDFEEAKGLGLRVEEMEQTIEEECSFLLLLLRMYESARKRNGHPLDTPFIRLYLTKKKKGAPKKTKVKEAKKEEKH